MRIPFLVVIALFSVTGGALAQNAGNGSVPSSPRCCRRTRFHVRLAPIQVSVVL